MYYIIISLVILLNLIQSIINAPLPQTVCPSSAYCTCQGTIECKLPSLENVTEILGETPVDKLLVDGCDGGITKPGLNIKTLIIHCDQSKVINNYLLLFKHWNPNLQTILNTHNGKLSTYDHNDNNNSTCFDTCNTIGARDQILNDSMCLCVTTVSIATTTTSLTLKSSETSTVPKSNLTDIATTSLSSIVTSTFVETSTVLTTGVTISTSASSNTTLPNSNIVSTTTNNNNTLSDGSNAYHFHFLVIISSISLFTLIVNFVLLTRICSTNEANVIDCFGVSLMVCNICIALYGIALSVYLSQNHTNWHQKFCQGFNSMKLFGLGASVWTMILITFHHGIRTSTGEERDAIFKGIVYILEGLMLSGVLAVMSWIKLDRWEYLCVIYEPKTKVEWLLTGIELWYYFITLVLVVRYPIHQLRKKKKVADARFLNQNHPIFLMIFICSLSWIGGYVITMPWFQLFGLKLRSVIRVSCLMSPLALQPIIYAIRNTCCCTGHNCPCSKQKKKRLNSASKKTEDHSVLLVCDCTGNQTCPACESEDRVRYGDTMFFERKISESNGKANRRKKGKGDEVKKKVTKKVKKIKNKVELPRAIDRSPVLKTAHAQDKTLEIALNSDIDDDVEETPLLEKSEEFTKVENRITPKTLDITTDITPLMDDTDGIKVPPKATPESTPVKALKKQDSMNSPSEFPSFINMDTAIDVDALPKPKPSPKSIQVTQPLPKIILGAKPSTKLILGAKPSPKSMQGVKPLPKSMQDVKPLPKSILEVRKEGLESEEGRKSRGPTFYPLDEDAAAKQIEITEKKKKKRKSKNDVIQEENCEISNTQPEKKKTKKCDETTKVPKRKRKTKKQNSTESEKTPTHGNQRCSTISLEWDHSYSYSDSSASSSGSRGSETFTDDIIIKSEEQPPTSIATVTATTTATTPEKNGVQNTPKSNDVKSEKDYAMEWDPSACQIKPSPEIKSDSTTSNPKISETNIELKNNKNNTKTNGNDIIRKNSLNTNGKITASKAKPS